MPIAGAVEGINTLAEKADIVILTNLADKHNEARARQLAEHGIEGIDLLVSNLYPFEATVAGSEPGLLRGQQILPVPMAPDEDETHGHRSVLAEFIDAVKSGRKPETVSDDNIKSLSMVFGAIESARTGLPVSISVEGH